VLLIAMIACFAFGWDDTAWFWWFDWAYIVINLAALSVFIWRMMTGRWL
jgi:hypothetical protein